MLRFIVHYGIHFIVPILIAWLFYRNIFWKTCLILLLGIIIDIDHLWANPIFDPNRCSIGFHFLHSYPMIAVYLGLLFFKRTRIFGIALCIHIIADLMDCYLRSFSFFNS
ncbi:DUF6122 family protein [Galbibacter sp. EGI 63066]|uniref:DUF6122 family protein n=1 Tax=Galbibacter sp. EGI 63066 TaxID=2993559 RepID=UPI0022492F7B|nr:DUF6122 family protein [Galbibacter sp. EGI 63066]MCX2681542.1 DUF6122 family protein [Galbibacter sp. EGI 63066]